VDDCGGYGESSFATAGVWLAAPFDRLCHSVLQCSGPEHSSRRSGAARQALVQVNLPAMWPSKSPYQNQRARCLANMLLVFSVEQVIGKLQLLQIQVTFAVNAVSERSQAIAQLFWKLMHCWACLGVCCGSCMILLESSEGKVPTLHVMTSRPDRHCLSWIAILDQLLLPLRLYGT
jgi:hypothetical protein